jgi:predicted nucleic acid-binding protein
MQAVVADTGPLNYLIQIEAIDLLPQLFGRIFVPAAVQDELAHPLAPAVVRTWVAHSPPWLEVKPNPDSTDVAASPAWTRENGRRLRWPPPSAPV